MTLNDLRDDIFALAATNGFHGKEQDDLCKKLMLVVCELAEAVEAERSGQKPYPKDWEVYRQVDPSSEVNVHDFGRFCRGSIEEEIADAVIRLADIAGMINMDLDWWVKAKMAYNKSRPFRHGKRY